MAAYPGNYNQPGGYPPQPKSTGYGSQQSNPTVVVTGQPTVLIQQFREAPVRTHCQSCGADILTSTHYETGTMTWVVAGVMCIIGYVKSRIILAYIFIHLESILIIMTKKCVY